MFWAYIFSYSVKALKSLIYSIVTMAVFMLSSAWANDIPGLPEETRALAIKIGHQIENENLVNNKQGSASLAGLDNLSPHNQISKLRHLVHDALNRRNNFDISVIVNKYISLAQTVGSERDKAIGDLFNVISKNFNPENPHESLDNLDVFMAAVEPFTSHADWFIAQNAWLYKSLINSYYLNNNLALQQAETALKLIPNELSPEVTEARIEIIDHTAYLHNLMRNPTLGAKNTTKLIALQKAANKPIDGINLINNLIYAFNSWRDHKTAGELVQILSRVEKNAQSGLPGLTQMRFAQTLIEQGQYQQAIIQTKEGLELAKIKTLQETLEILHISALAGIGEVGLAEKALERLENTRPDGQLFTGRTPQRILHAKALIAKNKGDAKSTHELMNKRMDASIQSILTANNTETVKFLASLENSKNRQNEREDALRRETRLKQAELEQKQKVNFLLSALSLIFAIAAFAAILVARYRDRVAKELEIAAQKAQAGDKAKSEFLAIMSHELRTPLNGIIGIADLLVMTAPNEDLKHKTNIILESGNELLGLVENIMDMSRLESGDVEIMKSLTLVKDIISRIDEKWRKLITKDDVIFTTYVDKTVPDLIFTDPKYLFQSIDNLVSNSVKFTKAGRIHVHASAEPVKGNSEVLLKINVADTGAGITPEVQKRLFQPFVQADSSITRHFGGAGLGLAITRSLARLMKGDVNLVSKPNRGSEFTLTIQDRFENQLKPLETTTSHAANSAPSPLQTLIQDKPNETTSEIIPEIIPEGLEKLQTPSPSSETVLVKKVNADNAEIEIVGDFNSMPAHTTQDNTPPLSQMPNAIEIMPPPMPLKPLELAKSKKSPNLENDETKRKTEDAYSPPFSILIVDDEPGNQNVIRFMLNDMGYDIHIANNGKEAVELAKVQIIDLVIMGIHMPVMDGIMATKIIRSLQSPQNAVPIIALSADTNAKINAEALNAGINFFLNKPIVKSELINAVSFFTGREAQTEKLIENLTENKGQTPPSSQLSYPVPAPKKALGL